MEFPVFQTSPGTKQAEYLCRGAANVVRFIQKVFSLFYVGTKYGSGSPGSLRMSPCGLCSDVSSHL